MKFKLKDIAEAINGLGLIEERRLPVTFAYAIAKNKKALYSEYELFIQQRKNILEKNCLKENGAPIVSETNEYTYENEQVKAETLAEQRELCETEIDVDIMMVSLDTVEKCDSEKYGSISAAEIARIDFMIE